MEKKYFVMKLNPSRPDFAATMTDDEKKIMREHINFWQPYLVEGTMLIMGPVMDPEGMYGLGIVAVDNEEQVKEFIRNDPASAINTYEYYPIMAVVGDRL
jgi:uncharacterized protein YciI